MEFFRVLVVLLLVLLMSVGVLMKGEAAKVDEEAAVNIHKLHRTGYHFQPPKNWINDPNAPMYYKGVYHLFYQYNPDGAVWGNIEWAHSVSNDLINWTPLKPALVPSKPYDKYGCWTGSATILPGNKPVIIYTGGIDKNNSQVQNYAIPANYSDPNLEEWIKPHDNPLLTPVNGINKTSFRDPTTAWKGPDGHWRMAIGGLRRKNRGLTYLYRSKNFKKWVRAKHPLHSVAGIGMWECPDFYPVAKDGKYGLDTSVNGPNVKFVHKVSLSDAHHEYYTIGRYSHVKDKYIPDASLIDGPNGLRYDYGNCYASKSFFDQGKKRRISWGWSNEADSHEDDKKKGWAGIMLIPRQVWLHPNGKQLLQSPVEELNTLRGDHVQLKNQPMSKGGWHQVSGITAAQADVEVVFSFSSLDNAETFDPSWATLDSLNVCAIKGGLSKGRLGPFGLATLASRDYGEYTLVSFTIFKDNNGGYKVLMCTDARRASTSKGYYTSSYGGYTPSFGGWVDADLSQKKISLRSLIDNSVVESFGVEGKIAMSARVYPVHAVYDKAELYAFNNGTEIVTVETLDAWTMNRPLMN